MYEYELPPGTSTRNEHNVQYRILYSYCSDRTSVATVRESPTVRRYSYEYSYENGRQQVMKKPTAFLQSAIIRTKRPPAQKRFASPQGQWILLVRVRVRYEYQEGARTSTRTSTSTSDILRPITRVPTRTVRVKNIPRRGGILLQTNPRLTSVSHMARTYPKDPPWPYTRCWRQVLVAPKISGSQVLGGGGGGGGSPRPENFSQKNKKSVFSVCFRDKSVQNP